MLRAAVAALAVATLSAEVVAGQATQPTGVGKAITATANSPTPMLTSPELTALSIERLEIEERAQAKYGHAVVRVSWTGPRASLVRVECHFFELGGAQVAKGVAEAHIEEEPVIPEGRFTERYTVIEAVGRQPVGTPAFHSATCSANIQ